MRITLLANRDVHANRVVDRLLRRLSGPGAEHELSLILSQRVGRADALPAELRDLRLHEQTLLQELLGPLLATAQRPAGATRTFDEIGALLDGRLQVVDRPRSAGGRAALLQHAPELMISIRYGGILDAAHADAVPLGILNLHSGRLPDYRGILASLQALLAGESQLCCTLHRITDAGIDTGPVIATATIDHDPTRSLLWNLTRLYEPGIELIVDAVERLAAGDALPGVPQDPHAGAYFGLPGEDELARFRALGLQLTNLGDTLERMRQLYLDDPGDAGGAGDPASEHPDARPDPGG